MNRKEAAQIVTILQANYPDSFRGMSDRMLQMTIRLWENVFASDDYMAVQAAVMAHIATDTNRFMPPCGVIKNALISLMNPDEMTEDEAWQLVRKAVKNSTYHAKEEYAKLPEACKRIVADAAQIRDWGFCDAQAFSVVESNFKRAYRTMIKRRKEASAIPDSVKAFVLAASEKAALPEANKTNGGEQQWQITEQRA